SRRPPRRHRARRDRPGVTGPTGRRPARRGTACFRARLRADLTEVFAAVRRGDVTARIAATLPLTQAAEALRLAESGTVTVTVKIVLTP
ncbi:zinc-binding dehydrogenase, partial [Streptomyces sp. NPDC007162]|uniref:zinc-binding dehydrogenase n=1 Tax=Streptomyces sp. NPDC007162 TaxID=3156917 RepID=UPI0034036075